MQPFPRPGPAWHTSKLDSPVRKQYHNVVSKVTAAVVGGVVGVIIGLAGGYLLSVEPISEKVPISIRITPNSIDSGATASVIIDVTNVSSPTDQRTLSISYTDAAGNPSYDLVSPITQVLVTEDPVVFTIKAKSGLTSQRLVNIKVGSGTLSAQLTINPSP
jgi:hypothetical protein